MIQRRADAPVNGNRVALSLPAQSFAMLVATGAAPALPDFAVPSDSDGGAAGAGGAAGCGCRVGGRAAPAWGSAGVLAVLLLALRRRRGPA